MDIQSRKAQPQPIVCCSNLPVKTTPEDLHTLFESVAPPQQIQMRKRSNVSMSALVHFDTIEESEKIVEVFNYHMMDGKQISVVLQEHLTNAPTDGNIVVKNLPENLNSSDLEGVFKMFGPIIRCMVVSDAEGKLLGYGYVQFRTPESAVRAVECCKSVKLGSKVLEVRAYDPKLRRSAAPADLFTNCFIKNFPSTTTKDKLLEILESFGGTVTSLHFPMNENGLPVGFACANYEKPEQAREAIEKLHGRKVFEKTGEENAMPPFYIQRAEEKENRAELLKRRMETLSLGGLPAKCNLYVSNIPDTFTEEEIKGIFMKFGNIVDFKISGCAPGTNKMYGYVCYSTPEEACVAFEKVDGSCLDRCKLQISYYKTKREREIQNGARKSGTGKHSEKYAQELYDAVLAVADLHKESWDTVGVNNDAEFAQKIAKLLAKAPVGRQKEFLSDSSKLKSQIKEVIFKQQETGQA